MNNWQFCYTNSPSRVRYLTSSAFIFASGETSFGCRLAFKRSGRTGVTPPVGRRSSHLRNAAESSGGALEPIRKLLSAGQARRATTFSRCARGVGMAAMARTGHRGRERWDQNEILDVHTRKRRAKSSTHGNVRSVATLVACSYWSALVLSRSARFMTSNRYDACSCSGRGGTVAWEIPAGACASK